MEPIQHDPQTKTQIKNALYAFLYAPVTRAFNERIADLISRNTIIGGYSHKHFIYKGVVYNGDTTTPPVRKNRLVVQLRDPMDEYLREQNTLNTKELPFVMGFINQVLNSSNNLSDYLRVLPESMHAPIHELQATCPCRATSLPQEKVELLKNTNQVSITLIRQRLVTNLIM